MNSIFKAYIIYLILQYCFINYAYCQKVLDDNEWQNVSALEAGLDSVKLDSLILLIERDTFPDIHSLLIFRNGMLAVEEYFNGFDKETIHMLQSVSKSFTSAIIGIAIDKKILKGVQEKVINFFPDTSEIKNMSEWKRSLKIEDILTMRTGIDYNERGLGSPHIKLSKMTIGWDTFYMNLPMINEPGSRFGYDSGGVILLSSIFKHITGNHIDFFANQTLFNDLNITRYHWFKNNEKHAHTAGGLYLTPRDIAKLGQLYLQKGEWNGKQIVSSDWIEESFKMHVKFDLPENHPYAGYGYLWWILKVDPADENKGYMYSAIGALGQYMFIIPKYDTIVVVTSEAWNNKDQANPISFLYSHILPALK